MDSLNSVQATCTRACTGYCLVIMKMALSWCFFCNLTIYRSCSVHFIASITSASNDLNCNLRYKNVTATSACRGVTAWIVAVAWIVTGDNSCRCSPHKLSPATIHAASISMNCRRRQFMPEISLILCTSPATIHAAWKKNYRHIIVAVGIFWRHGGLYLFLFFHLYIAFFYLVKVQMNFFLRYSSYSSYSSKAP